MTEAEKTMLRKHFESLPRELLVKFALDISEECDRLRIKDWFMDGGEYRPVAGMIDQHESA